MSSELGLKAPEQNIPRHELAVALALGRSDIFLPLGPTHDVDDLIADGVTRWRPSVPVHALV